MGPFNRVALPGVAPSPPLWVWCPLRGAIQHSTVSFKGSPFKSADRAQLSVPANSYEFGRELENRKQLRFLCLGPLNPPVPHAFEAPAGDLCRFKWSRVQGGKTGG